MKKKRKYMRKLETSDNDFSVGGLYACRTGMGETLTFRCVSRTLRYVQLHDMAYGKDVKIGVFRTSDGIEYCYPLGRYLSKPVLFASNKLDEP